jgi:DeoR/GlpR family transcriptional regulator of sugar metabolism
MVVNRVVFPPSDLNGRVVQVRSTITNQRLEKITEYIAKSGRASIAELGDLLKVSQGTIRRDIDKLSNVGTVIRLHGGAAWPETPKLEPPIYQRGSVNFAEKQKIGKKASELIQEGETVFLGSGSTVIELAKNLRTRKGLTVITNSLPVLNTLSDCPDINVIVTGGFLRHSELSFIGHFVEKSLAELRADKVVIGIHGIHLEHGLTNDFLPEAMSDRAIIRFSKTVVIVADSTKLGKVKPSFVAELAAVSEIVTDRGAPADFVAELNRRGIRVTIAEAE